MCSASVLTKFKYSFLFEVQNLCYVDKGPIQDGVGSLEQWLEKNREVEYLIK